MPVRTVEDPVFKTRYAFERTTDDEGAELLLVQTWVEPGGGVPAHVHPAMEERFKTLAGSPERLAGRKWQATSPGDQVVVPAGTRHAFRNRGDEVAHLVTEVQPPSTLQGFLEDSAALSRSGGINRFALPKSFGGLLQAAVMIEHYRDMVVLLSPPPFLQRLIMPPLARLGARRCYRAGFAESATA
jgi:quercetin dioxygenase-like cupin family protein